MAAISHRSIPRCLELSLNLKAYWHGLLARDGCPNHRLQRSATAYGPCLRSEWERIGIDIDDPVSSFPQPAILLSQGEARPGMEHGQHWGSSLCRSGNSRERGRSHKPVSL